MNRVPDSAWTGHGDPHHSFRILTDNQRGHVERAMDLIASVANVRYVELSETSAPHLLVGSFDMTGNTAGFANCPFTFRGDPDSLGIGDLWLDIHTGVGSLSVILHELCHTLGLKHPFEGDHLLPDSEDRHANTIMSYDWSTDPQNLMVYDVIALQSIYGPARLRRGDDTYVFGQDKVIWDGGGHDRIDARGATAAVTLSLDDGRWNHMGAKAASFLAQGQVWLGDFTIIEDALGSRFADRLAGNGRSNDLRGGAGNDVLAGGGGRDDLWGGRGQDRFVFTRRSDSGVADQRDVIRDFADGDHVDLSALHLSWRGSRSFTGAGDEARVFDLTSGVLVLIDFDGDRAVDFALRVLGIDQLDRGDVLL
ncbi:M10 family metallopeptidase C-terminal domain-containing protein [Rubellimicrobium roseum]|nr:M10 family metallopeptidase C-terminal domain-containing protein [Rubellimicrobium roseum]